MSASDKPSAKGGCAPVVRAYLTASAACALFGAVYELFGHGVYSLFMICAFAPPLLCGFVPFFLLGKAGKPLPGGLAAELIHAGAAALTVGSIMQGVLEIYGTTNPLVTVYWIVGGVLSAVGWLSAIPLFQGVGQADIMKAAYGAEGKGKNADAGKGFIP